MELADLEIDGKPRKVLMTAPKNGFFYVIDRTNGKLISAEQIAKVTWATQIDLETGRPVEIPAARYPERHDASSSGRARSARTAGCRWRSARKTGLVYIPAHRDGDELQRQRHRSEELEAHARHARSAWPFPTSSSRTPAANGTSALLAWNPVTQKAGLEGADARRLERRRPGDRRQSRLPGSASTAGSTPMPPTAASSCGRSPPRRRCSRRRSPTGPAAGNTSRC